METLLLNWILYPSFSLVKAKVEKEEERLVKVNSGVSSWLDDLSGKKAYFDILIYS